MNLTPGTRIAVWIACLLCIPAFFINLGFIPFIEDEAIRAIVAYEMLQSGNYIVPTINGDPYYYKPPLYNWVIALSYQLFGEVSEWTTRVPTVVLLFGFCTHIYLIVKRHTDHQVYAAAVALTFLTCGRILFYDSFLGLIDIGFSWVAFVLLVKFYEVRDRPSQMVTIYLLAAVSYLLKGFPAFVFLGCGMAAYVIYYREVRALLTKWHLFGIILLVTILGAYYGAYLQYQDPTTWLNKDQKEYNRFSDFMGILFLTNIPVYWVSPGTYPRYLIMLIPLYFGYFLAYYFRYKDSAASRSISIILVVLMVLVGLSGLAMYWTPLGETPLLIGLGIGLFAVTASLLYAIKQSWIPVWSAMVIVLLCVRIIFDIGILPTKNIRNGQSRVRVETARITDTYKPLHIYKNGRLDKASSYYLATSMGRPLDRQQELEPSKYYILDTMRTEFPTVPYQRVDSFQIVEKDRMVYIIVAD